jgi:uncharacterized SAM-binding protein YcdF (DUF218 family)
MFLFLSKLLPPLLYPLGLACVCILLALVTLWKRPRLSAGANVVALLLLLGCSNAWVSDALTKSLERQYVPGFLPSADAIVVLGGLLKPADSPRLAPDLGEPSDRIVYAAQLYRAGKAPWLICSGGRASWRSSGALLPPESADMADLAHQLGVPKSAILEDPISLNTYENAVNVQQILQRHQLKTVLLVTSAIHMPRSIAIFRKQGIVATPAPTDFLIADPPSDGVPARLVALGILPDAERLQRVSHVFKEYLGLLVYRLRGWL